MSEDGAASAVTGGRPGRRRRPDPVSRMPGRRAFLLTAILSAIPALTALLPLPQAPAVEVPWIPAFAGMTVRSDNRIGVDGIIPAPAGMTVGAPAIEVPGAQADENGEHRWIPAFAGTTVRSDNRIGVDGIIPASAGMTVGAPAPGESGAVTRVVGEPRLVSTFTRVAALARIGHRPGRGMFLLAAPRLRDPRFAQTVVLLLEYDRTGALGLVINRPTEASLHDVLATPLPNSEGHAVFAGARSSSGA